jgi:hypothetical protein
MLFMIFSQTNRTPYLPYTYICIFFLNSSYTVFLMICLIFFSSIKCLKHCLKLEIREFFCNQIATVIFHPSEKSWILNYKNLFSEVVLWPKQSSFFGTKIKHRQVRSRDSVIVLSRVVDPDWFNPDPEFLLNPDPTLKLQVWNFLSFKNCFN